MCILYIVAYIFIYANLYSVVAEIKIRSDNKLAERLSRYLNDFRDKTRSTEVGKILNTLKKWHMEILQTYRNAGIVIWIWCKTEEALRKLQEITEDGSILDILRNLFRNLCSKREIRFLRPRNVNVKKDIFAKEVGKLFRVSLSHYSQKPIIFPTYYMYDDFTLIKLLSFHHPAQSSRLLRRHIRSACLYISFGDCELQLPILSEKSLMKHTHIYLKKVQQQK